MLLAGTQQYSRVMSSEVAPGDRVADAMVKRPKTHDPDSTLAEIRVFFDDDHVHMALIVAADGRLVTTIERADLTAAAPGRVLAATLGTLSGRTARPEDRLDASAAALRRHRRRRLAVVDDRGRLLGLLCAKQDGTGYCSDAGIRMRNHLSKSAPQSHRDS